MYDVNFTYAIVLILLFEFVFIIKLLLNVKGFKTFELVITIVIT